MKKDNLILSMKS